MKLVEIYTEEVVTIHNEMNGNQKMPDFDSLHDRIINRPSVSPSIEIKTNLDKDNLIEDNPYYDEKDMKNEKEQEKFEEFFDRDGE